jgi:hypothetical protein
MTIIEFLDKALEVARKLETIIPWAGYLLVSVIGGAGAYVKEWEDKHPERTLRQHLAALLRKLFLALFAGMLWYWLVVWQQMTGSPLSYLGATLVGLYSGEFLDFLWTQMKTRLSSKAAVTKDKE